MTIKLSTGLKNALLSNSAGVSLPNAFESGGNSTALLVFYSGNIPADADAAVTGSVLAVVGKTLVAAGALISEVSTSETLQFTDPAVSGILSKVTSDTWSGPIIASGTISFWRIVETSDGTTNLSTLGTSSSTTAKRIQGTIGPASTGIDADGNRADGILLATAVTTPGTQSVDAFSLIWQ